MKITMLSNAMSHHQKPLCDKLASMEGVDFTFVATKPISAERLGMGYADLNKSADYILRAYESEESEKRARQLSDDSDFVIYGSAPYSYIKNRNVRRKWLLLYSERIFKTRGLCWKNIRLWMIYVIQFGHISRRKSRILCAGTYSPKDFSLIGFQQSQMLKWGYFPPISDSDTDDLLLHKIPRSLLWVGRMIPWKHPETALHIACRLKENGVSFHLTMIGDGVLYEDIKSEIINNGLESYITMTGALSTDEVRKVMEKSEIMLSTSDQGEGWGAVINEGMSSACAVCASREMGAAEFLIRDGENGYIFSYNDEEKAFGLVRYLLENDERRRIIAVNATKTIKEEWNADNAAQKLFTLCENIKKGNTAFAFGEGVCSIAEIRK